MLKYLRIAVTVLSLTAGGLLVSLWLRSSGTQDTFMSPIPGLGGGFEVNSLHGRIDVMGRIRRERWPVRIYSMNELAAMLGCTNRYDFSAAVPHCCLIAVAGGGCRCALDPLAIQPPHTAHRHDARGTCAGHPSRFNLVGPQPAHLLADWPRKGTASHENGR